MIETVLLNLVCLAPFCAGAAMLLVAAFFIIRTAAERGKPLATEQIAAEAENLRKQVNWLMIRLTAWHPAALAELSTNWDAKWSRLARDLRAHGTIPIVQRPGMSLVAFALRVHVGEEITGVLHARTTAQAFDYRLWKGGIEVHVNGSPLGQIRADGALLDGSGQVIGEVKRSEGLAGFFQAGGVTLRGGEAGLGYPIVLNGTTIARAANPPLHAIDAFELNKRKPCPVVEILDASPVGAEEWMWALAILQNASHLFESVWKHQGGLYWKRAGRYR